MTARDEKGRYLIGCEPGPGRDTKFEPWMIEQAFRLALLGLTNKGIATAFGITEETFYAWMRENPAFSEAVNKGKEPADAEVAHSLFQRAKGMTVMSEKAFKGKNGEVVVAQTKTQIPPDTRAAAIWLANRRRKQWGSYDEQQQERERAEAGSDALSEEQIRGLSQQDLNDRIADLERRRAVLQETEAAGKG